MARIRTIKPEFWTDEKIVRLPFDARLLFIGLWNFADDSGAVDFSPDRLRMQIFPGDPVLDVGALIDLLAAAELIDYWVSENNEHVAVVVRNWAAHQKIDNPSKKSITREGYRKFAIPNEARLAVANKYGCEPGGTKPAQCYYCGFPGAIHWHKTYDGKPTRWVTLSDLEFDHFIAEHSGGKNNSENIVLACRTCNRGKKNKDPHSWLERKNPSVVLASPIEGSVLEGIGKDRKGEEAAQQLDAAREDVSRETPEPWSTKAELDRLEAELREAAGLAEDPSTGLFDLSPMVALLRKGWSLSGDILPVLRATAAKGKRGKTWAYYVPAITEKQAANGAIPAKPEAAIVRPVVWLDKDDPRFAGAAEAYHTATGKTALPNGSRHNPGIGFSFPAEHVPEMDFPDIPAALRREPAFPLPAGGA